MERLIGIKDVIENNKRFSSGEMLLIKIDDVDWLIEQVEKIERYEKVLHALLPLCLQTDNDIGLDMITDSLNEFEILEQYNSIYLQRK